MLQTQGGKKVVGRNVCYYFIIYLRVNGSKCSTKKALMTLLAFFPSALCCYKAAHILRVTIGDIEFSAVGAKKEQ